MHFVKNLKNQAETRTYTIATIDGGWEVREERDSRLVKKVRYSDWHRVERARRTIAHELDVLRRAGWIEQ
ncbi:MAG TPA: hypothetical protein VFP85_18800 [Vicinamibacterales bacterium]|nr:hypothetical protein [Vicinamibacterales bacterium]